MKRLRKTYDKPVAVAIYGGDAPARLGRGPRGRRYSGLQYDARGRARAALLVQATAPMSLAPEDLAVHQHPSVRAPPAHRSWRSRPRPAHWRSRRPQPRASAAGHSTPRARRDRASAGHHFRADERRMAAAHRAPPGRPPRLQTTTGFSAPSSWRPSLERGDADAGIACRLLTIRFSHISARNSGRQPDVDSELARGSRSGCARCQRAIRRR